MKKIVKNQNTISFKLNAQQAFKIIKRIPSMPSLKRLCALSNPVYTEYIPMSCCIQHRRHVPFNQCIQMSLQILKYATEKNDRQTERIILNDSLTNTTHNKHIHPNL